ncbi:sporulation histidine kinase inhibitor Sda [Sporolactobacillus sp. Y61]|jgi:hypothetical protein|uniref:Sporulation histidine kinase inhibitor Sda n=1 Tax=Sporolactobacillus sp. Y61 TaxID=3160863 RepID=A0AAU8IEU1_9BACL|nr:sporulation histidine kinase inhibitor Sda [Sporolactobacillus sp. THM19-2]RYL94752.1 sporulation histidine kinase inhibitor Sda [Sporolactobacillus sp. THM19-2]
MENLSDEMLVEAYVKAKKYDLSDEFIKLIEGEISRRKLNRSLHQQQLI